MSPKALADFIVDSLLEDYIIIPKVGNEDLTPEDIKIFLTQCLEEAKDMRGARQDVSREVL